MISLQPQLSCYTDGDMLSCALEDLVASVGGEPQFGLLVGGVLILSLWIAGDGDLATPAVVTTLIGGLLFPILSPTFATIAQTIAFLGLVAALLSAFETFVITGRLGS